jgi:hypothetical protein
MSEDNLDKALTPSIREKLNNVFAECKEKHKFSPSAMDEFEQTRNQKWLDVLNECAGAVSKQCKSWVSSYEEIFNLGTHPDIPFGYSLSVGLREFTVENDGWTDRVSGSGCTTSVWYVSHGHCLVSLAIHLLE